VVLRLSGELDLSTADALRSALAEALAGDPGRLVVDLADVTFVDPAGIRPLTEAAVRRRGAVTLRAARPRVRRALTLMELGHLLDRG
jgi:anti-sigma B factor antagonist